MYSVIKDSFEKTRKFSRERALGGIIFAFICLFSKKQDNISFLGTKGRIK